MMVPITFVDVDVDVGADGVALLSESTKLQYLPKLNPPHGNKAGTLCDNWIAEAED